METEKKIQAFSSVFGMPDFLISWVDRFFENVEINLILHLARGPLTRKEILREFLSEATPGGQEETIDLVTRSYQRGILNRRKDNRFEPADFHARFDKWAMFEGWKDIPDEVRERLIHWELAYYKNRHADQIRQLKNGLPRDSTLIYPEYILLHEAEALLDRAKTIYLMPCNCRSMVQGCTQSVYTCIRFDKDRGLGWEISTSRAKEIVRLANKKGLMQSGEVRVTEDGEITGAICNCCTDCCFPHKLAENSEAQKLWPLSRYVARHREDNCISCGLCVKRCPFQAFSLEKQQEKTKGRSRNILFDPNLCRGCGVCCTACRADAIEMVAIEDRPSSTNDILNRR